MKKRRVLIGIHLAVILAAVFSPPSVKAVLRDGALTAEPAAGQLILDKQAVTNSMTSKSANKWYWDIELTVRGLDLIGTSDVVIVIDRSGSMDESSKMETAKDAAKKFVSELLASGGGNTRIALVSFSDYSSADGFTTDIDLLHSKIDAINAYGGTHIQSALHSAQELLDTSSADSRYIILLGDGQPTYSFSAASVQGDVLLHHNSDGSHEWIYDPDSVTMTFNYNMRVGNGGNYLISGGGVQYLCDMEIAIPSLRHRLSFPDNHGLPTIYEANLIKAKGTKIFTIAFLSDQTGEMVLQECASEPDYYYCTGSLDGVFRSIAGKIHYSAVSAEITDPMGRYFTIVDPADGAPVQNGINAAGVTVSKGTFSVEDYTDGSVPEVRKKIIWDLGSVIEAEGVYSLKYTVQIDSDPAGDGICAPAETLHRTNDPAYITYTDSAGNSDTKKWFPMPEVSYSQIGIITKVIYIVDSQGCPVNAQGKPAVHRNEISWIRTEPFKIPASDGSGNTTSALPYGSYKVPAEGVIEENGVVYVLVSGGSTLGDPNPVSVNLDENNQSPRVYFAYRKGTPDQLNYLPNGGAGLTEPSVAGEYSDVIVKDNEFIRPGYTFQGWNTEQDGTGVSYSEGSLYTLTADNDSLYAQWKENDSAPDTETENETNNSGSETGTGSESAPQTGSTSYVFLHISSMSISLILLRAMLRKRRLRED